MSKGPKPTHLLWIDLEATGDDVHLDDPLEVAAILTGNDHVEVARYESLIYPGDEALARAYAHPDVSVMHAQNGLFDDLVTAGRAAPGLTTVEADLIAMLDEHGVQPRAAVLSGSGVAHYDHGIILARMPALAARLAFFTNDTGALRRAYIRANNGRPLTHDNKRKNHRAMVDIECHLAEGRAFHELLNRKVA